MGAIDHRKAVIVSGLVFLILCAVYLFFAMTSNGQLFFRPIWDIEHYQTIAQHGYEVYPCVPGVHFPAGKICGNPGWFPGWPLAVKILSFGEVETGIIILPYLFTFLGFYFVYRAVHILSNHKVATLSIIALAGMPTGFYFLTGFPYAFMLFLFGLYLYCLYSPDLKYRKLYLPLLAAIYSLTYPTACLLAIVPLIFLFKQWRINKSGPTEIIKDITQYVIPFAAGPLLLSIYFYFKFDDFMLFLHFQAKYGRTWGFPLTLFYESLKFFTLNKYTYAMTNNFTYAAANYVILWYLLIFSLFPPYRVKTELVIFGLVLFLFPPTTGALLSVWRHYLLIFPAAFMIAASPRPIWLKLCMIALGLALSLYYFFPYYIRGVLI